MTPANPDPNRHNAGTMSDDTGNDTTEQKLKEDARDVKREMGATAREQAQSGQHQLADGADALSEAIDAAASSLDHHDREGLARYARELSSNLASAAGQLEGRSVDELARDAKRLARNSPALFMLGSIAVGFGLSRFFKASAERDHHDEHDVRRNDDSSRHDDIANGTPVPQREQAMTNTYAASTTPNSSNGRLMP